MKRLGGLLVIGVLLLSGCASSNEDAAPSGTASASATEPEPAPAIEGVSSYTEISTLNEGLEYARSLSSDTPNLAAELSGTAIALGDLVVEADLPYEVNNAIGQGLISLNNDVLNDPASAEAQLSEMNLIADKIEASL
jgi:hypothetical protein